MDSDKKTMDPPKLILPPHQVSLIPDILERVFDFLTPTDHEIQAAFFSNVQDSNILNYRRTLYASALVCKAFYPPASSALWRVMDSISPFCKMLPIGKNAPVQGMRIPNMLTFNASKLQSRLQCVRVFIYKSHAEDEASALSILTALSQPAFPKLQILIIPCFSRLMAPSPNHSYQLHLFSDMPFGSPIQTLVVGGIQSNTQQICEAFITSICLRTHRTLQHFYLDMDFVPTTVSALPATKTLHLSGQIKDVPSWDSISSLRGIEDLDLGVSPQFPFGSFSQKCFGIPIRLRLVAETTRMGLALFQCGRERLEELTLSYSHLYRYSSYTNYGPYMSIPSSLRSLTINNAETIVENHRFTGFPYSSMFKDLRMFPTSLQVLKINIAPLMSGVTEAINLVQNFPNIKTLHLPKSVPGSGFSFNAMFIVASICSKLEEFRATIVADKEFEANIPEGFAHPLRVLEVYDSSPPQKIIEFGEALDEVFPQLRRIGTHFDPPPSGAPQLKIKDSWEQVEKAAKACQRARFRHSHLRC